MTCQAPAAVTFDAGNTLLRCDPTPAAIYAEALSRHGREVTAEEVGPAFSSVWADMQGQTPAGSDRYRSFPGGERAWWGAFVREVLARLRHGAPWEVLLDELYQAFERPDVWRSFPEVEEVLIALADDGLRLAVISNWDSRLPDILSDLGLTRHFDVITVSSLEGVEKPARTIFTRTLDRLGVTPARAMHVGDSPVEDYGGALEAGMQPVLIDRAGLFADTRMRRVDSLQGVTDLVRGLGWARPTAGSVSCSTR